MKVPGPKIAPGRGYWVRTIEIHRKIYKNLLFHDAWIEYVALPNITGIIPFSRLEFSTLILARRRYFLPTEKGVLNTNGK